MKKYIIITNYLDVIKFQSNLPEPGKALKKYNIHLFLPWATLKRVLK